MKLHLQNLLVSVFLATLLTACIFLPGDGSIRVTGELLNEPQNCSIYLQRESGEVVQFSETPIYKRKFSADFVVPPRAETYEVIVSCDDFTRKNFIIHYPTNNFESRDLGKILL
jgi:hypothetical protein